MSHSPPPPGTRTMAVLRWALVAAMALVAAGAVLSWAGFTVGRGAGAAHGQVYYCPMHPQVVQDRPGECPICNMSLVPRPPGPVVPSATMQPALAPPGDGGAGTGAYWCPMHPEVSSDDPDAICEACGGMKLLPRDKPAAGAGPAGAAGVPGLVPIELGPERIQLAGVRTAQAVRAPLGGQLRATGIVAPNERGLAQITTRFGGYVEKLLVAENGQRVRKGQPLALVYSPEVLRVQQELLTARAWQAPDPNAGAAPEHHGLVASLDEDARRRLELLGVARVEIEELLRTGKAQPALPVRSPVDGHVIVRNAVLGGSVQPGMPLFEVADLGTVWVLAEMAETDAGRVTPGQKATLELAAYPGETFTGKVAFVYPTLDAGTRTLRARIEFRNRTGPAGPKLRPGMYGAVTLALPAAEALVIPIEALVDTGEVQYVFVAREGGRFEPRRVRRGQSDGDRVQILEGLAAGEAVVTTANFLLDSESRLRAAVEGRAGGGAAGHQH